MGRRHPNPDALQSWNLFGDVTRLGPSKRINPFFSAVSLCPVAAAARIVHRRNNVPGSSGQVIAHARLGGLHHRYERAAGMIKGGVI